VVKLNLKLENDQFIKYADKKEVIRENGRQRTVITRNLDGILLTNGQNKIKDTEYQKIENSPWLIHLVNMGVLEVENKEVEKPKLKTKQSRKRVNTKVGE
jgi:hypothetical protein